MLLFLLAARIMSSICFRSRMVDSSLEFTTAVGPPPIAEELLFTIAVVPFPAIDESLWSSLPKT